MATKKKPTLKGGRAKLKLSAHFRRLAKAPLKKKGTSDAWNERQNRLASSRISADLLIKGTREVNQAKRVKRVKRVKKVKKAKKAFATKRAKKAGKSK